MSKFSSLLAQHVHSPVWNQRKSPLRAGSLKLQISDNSDAAIYVHFMSNNCSGEFRCGPKGATRFPQVFCFQCFGRFESYSAHHFHLDSLSCREAREHGGAIRSGSRKYHLYDPAMSLPLLLGNGLRIKIHGCSDVRVTHEFLLHFDVLPVS